MIQRATELRKCLPGAGHVVVVFTALLAAWGCTERNVDPVAVLLTNETRATVALEGRLPVLGRVAEELDLEEELGDALRLWSRSWSQEGEGRWAYRMAAYESALRVLGRQPQAVQHRLVDDTHRAARVLEALPSHVLPPELRGELLVALERSAQADAAWHDGRTGDALRMALESADRIRELSPPVVAGRLVRRLEQEWDFDGHASAEEAHRERAERLLKGARHAFEREDYLRAIRRAHYAEQLLLNGNGSGSR